MKNLSEDAVSILLGVIILGIALLVFLLLPYTEVAPAILSGGNLESWMATADFGSGISGFLQTLISGSRPSAWGLNPLAAFPPSIFGFALLLFALLAALLGAGILLLKENLKSFVKGFVLVFLVTVLAYLLAAQTEFRSVGLGYALWAIMLGLLISNIFGIPDFVRPALKHELFIKTGLVLLGAEVLFGKILAIGLPGIFVAWIVTPVVLISTFWFGDKILKVSSKTLNVTLSAAGSVCGVSAAIATAAACRATKEELTTAIGLSMIFTAAMMVAFPAFITAVEMPEVLGGAWMGGVIDATGAVVLAGAFLGETALDVAATIKMIQNILIGVLAFAVALYWTAKVDRTAGQDVTAIEIWNRFPKFVLGFVGASLFFSLVYQVLNTDVAIVLIENGALDFSSDVRAWLFALGFASIGLSTNFKELTAQFSGGKPLILYVCGQSLNLVLTLLMAWIMFYLVFPEITNAL